MTQNGWVRNLSVRVPWQDRPWDGHVCNNPMENSSCLALKLIAENRKDDIEMGLSGEAFQDIEQEKLPPCIRSSASFLSSRPQKFKCKMPYAVRSEDHAHILPSLVEIPAWGATIIPYKWMLKEYGFEIAGNYEINAMESSEPTHPGWLANTDWIQGFDNQRELLDFFSAPLIENESLVFFYADKTPLSDDNRRVLIGAAILTKKFPLVEYPYGEVLEPHLRAMVWDRPIQHSLRKLKNEIGYENGFVMPYQDLLYDGSDLIKQNLSEYMVFIPNDIRPNFSYYSEHVSHGISASVLLSAKNAFERINCDLDGPWNRYIEWIDTQVSKLWTLRGPVPGLGNLLSALHSTFNGTLFAIAIENELITSNDPWEYVDSIINEKIEKPDGIPKITNMFRKRWNKCMKNDQTCDQLKLLARFELTKEQAERALEIQIPEILDNPYILFEQDRESEDPISFATIDRGMHPGQEITGAYGLPDSCESVLTEPDSEMRLRAACVEILEQNSVQGNTYLPVSELKKDVKDLGVVAPIPLDEDTVELCQEEFSPVVHVFELSDEIAVQLERYSSMKRQIELAINERIEPDGGIKEYDWQNPISEKFGELNPNDSDEIEARREKAIALSKLANCKIGVLIGPAGTGKTSVLQLLLNVEEIVGPKIILLAPTGKARVRLGASTEGYDVKTVAQFLLRLDRFDFESGRYFVNPSAGKVNATTCIVDESSMLTEDMLAAIIDCLDAECRLILVGDPYQLPPIGAGKPFVDIINYLNDKAGGAGVGELTIIRRQINTQSKNGENQMSVASRSDVQLASLFSGRGSQLNEEEVISNTLSGNIDDTLNFIKWESINDLSEKLEEVMNKEIEKLSNELEHYTITDDLIGNFEQSFGAKYEAPYFNFLHGMANELENWQILSVNRNMPGGSIYLNRLIKEKFRNNRLKYAHETNLQPKYMKISRTIEPRGLERITYGDKVICIRNHWRKFYSYETMKQSTEEVFLANGEIGIVLGEISKKRVPKFTIVEFADRVAENFSFYPSEFREEAKSFLELAYAITVHKAQGSEFGSVILVLPSNSQLISREMIYTALTRQKKRLWVLHQGDINEFLKYRSKDPLFSSIEMRFTNLFKPSD